MVWGAVQSGSCMIAVQSSEIRQRAVKRGHYAPERLCHAVVPPAERFVHVVPPSAVFMMRPVAPAAHPVLTSRKLTSLMARVVPGACVSQLVPASTVRSIVPVAPTICAFDPSNSEMDVSAILAPYWLALHVVPPLVV